ncbi:MAG: GntR family transcriptional regulator [Candidimonas sp.]|nr:MAG: GntR family transcriptional regulator [Candidimonas sp.]TAM80735.1 MAG: GntR family transcriptional regulator [Candidimonas sp.]
MNFSGELTHPQWEGDQSLREKVLQQIRFDVVSGKSPPGMVLSVPGVARQLGISTTPVREALLELSSAGLIEPLRNRGFRVVESSLQDLKDLFTLREQLETYALITVAKTGLKDKEVLEGLADAIAQAVQEGNVHDYLSADRAFHHALVVQAGNRLLTDTIMKLRDNMRLYGIDSKEGLVRQHASVKEHHLLVKLLSQGRQAEVSKLICVHIRDWEPVFSAAIVKSATRAASVA